MNIYTELDKLITIADSIPKGEDGKEQLIRQIRVIQNVIYEESKAFSARAVQKEIEEDFVASQKQIESSLADLEAKIEQEKRAEKTAEYIKSFHKDLRAKVDLLTDVKKNQAKIENFNYQNQGIYFDESISVVSSTKSENKPASEVQGNKQSIKFTQ